MQNVNEEVNKLLAGAGIDLAQEKSRIREEMKTDPTRMSPKDEFKAKVLRVVSDMLVTITDPEMLMKNKYEILTEIDVQKLFAICMEKQHEISTLDNLVV